MKKILFFSVLFLLLCRSLTAQQNRRLIQAFLQQNYLAQALHESDIKNWTITDQHYNPKTDLTYIYIRQEWQGIPLVNGVANFVVKQNKIKTMGHRLVANLAAKIKNNRPKITAKKALLKACQYLGLPQNKKLKLLRKANKTQFVFEKSNISLKNIPVRLVYYASGANVRLAWDLSIDSRQSSDWWSLQIDAQTGKILAKNNWLSRCAFGHRHSPQSREIERGFSTNFLAPQDPKYLVFALPQENPRQGARTLLINPFDSLASPFGWHDTDGQQGEEYSIVRGNNVYAYSDSAAANTAGFSPNGGTFLDFNFPYSSSPTARNSSAALTNLFYINNVMHDVWYHYGFDEAAGNFQHNNYHRGGLGQDAVWAEGEDGSSTNSATFASPPEGYAPRMQMFIWQNAASTSIRNACFDNLVIAHEYAHGISNRLVGGATNANCLQNAEQMGEGLSDWFGLMMTLKLSDQPSDSRAIATYLLGQNRQGQGLRPAAYSTDFAINNYTYGQTNNTAQLTVPHGVGFVYATVLWDLTWALIQQYGGQVDSNLYTGTGGNNVAMKLVLESLKIQACSPGMIDGRNAILQADSLLYNGLHNCLIWRVFARRGFGYSASQGSPYSRSDQLEAFDLPLSCAIPTQLPRANFSWNTVGNCQPNIRFVDASRQLPQQWFWDFGDSQTDNRPNPRHRYQQSGIYTVRLIVRNSLGADTMSQIVSINLPSPPVAADLGFCQGDSLQLVAQSTGLTLWLDSLQNVLHTGDTFNLPSQRHSKIFYVQNIIAGLSQYIAPANPTFGGGSYHVSSYHGALNMTAQKPLLIRSVWVDAQAAGWRTFYLAAGSNADGQAPSQIIDQVSVYLRAGGQRVVVDLEIPAAGNYNLGGHSVDLYRNSSGTNYPYILPHYLTIDSSSSAANPLGYYYYFYNIEVQDLPCVSPLDTVTIRVLVDTFGYTQIADTVHFFSPLQSVNYYWDFGDGQTSSLPNPRHIYSSGGTYTVTLSINRGQCQISQTISLNTAISTLKKTKNSVKLSPNPALNQTILEFERPIKEDLQIQIINLQGKVLYQKILLKNKLKLSLNLSNYAPAVYWVRIKGKYYKKILPLIHWN